MLEIICHPPATGLRDFCKGNERLTILFLPPASTGDRAQKRHWQTKTQARLNPHHYHIRRPHLIFLPQLCASLCEVTGARRSELGYLKLDAFLRTLTRHWQKRILGCWCRTLIARSWPFPAFFSVFHRITVLGWDAIMLELSKYWAQLPPFFYSLFPNCY